MKDINQISRFECKYLVPEFAAREIQSVLRHHMDLDPYCARRPGNTYWNCSLYVDSPGLMCHRSSQSGDKNRFKLRYRWYNGEPESCVVFEEKRRTTDAISKCRVHIGAEGLRQAALGGALQARDLLRCTNGGHARAWRLADLALRIAAQPACYVAYDREAWQTEAHEYLRVTFDRRLSARPLGGALPVPSNENWVEFLSGHTVLEVKFERAAPEWLLDAIRTFGLRRRSVPKYSLALEALDARGLTVARDPAEALHPRRSLA
ncbi:polyphosphate polymerase domain-containing protein [Candidatus Poribacteria bacterium]|nr:polyphosphate polymerase domain-containing protein [Candidatus Poribacteria bacterium]